MLTSIILTFGYVGVGVAIFAESGFLLGFFLPGDSLLFTAGIFSTGTGAHFNVLILLPMVIVLAIAGDSFGYWMGRRFGLALFSRPDSLLFKKSYVEKTREFYDRHGKKTIILARFVPAVRTFAPIFAGIGSMRYKTFLSYNVVGGTLWCCLMVLPAYFLGRAFPQIENYLSYIVIGIVVVSILPIVYNVVMSRRKNR